MRRLILAVALAASLLAVSAGTAVASAAKPPVVHDALGWNQDLTRPSFLGALYSRVPPKAIAAPVSAAARPVVVYEPAVTGPHPVRSVVRPSSWYLTIGPATVFRGAHWSSWGDNTAAGTATIYVIDFGTRNEGHARLKLYDVRNHDGTRYFSRLQVSGAKTENGVWNWCFSVGEWQASCQG